MCRWTRNFKEKKVSTVFKTKKDRGIKKQTEKGRKKEKLMKRQP